MILGTTEETRKMLEDVKRSHLTLDREEEKKYSSDPLDPNKSICCSAVTDHFGTTKLTTYLHNSGDIVASIAKKHNVADRDILVKGLTVESSRIVLKNNSLRELVNVKGYFIVVEDHAMLLDANGKTIVDTDPQEGNDNRIIEQCNIII